MNLQNTFGNLAGLYKVAKIRKQTPENYFKFQVYQGNLLVQYLAEKKVCLENTRTLDLACGIGGYSYALASAGANVTSLDLEVPQFLPGFKKIISDAIALPFENGTFDLVVCASLIEHVQSPDHLLNEIMRIVRRGGSVYLSYPPFYSPNGGHQFAPFHLFGEKVALKIAVWRGAFKNYEWLKQKYPDQPSSFREAFGRWGLYPLTIRQIRKKLLHLPIRLVDQSTRWLPIDFSKVPLLGEFLTWHVQFLFEKK